MTALAGLWRWSGPGEVERDCGRMLEAQQVYAPDRPRSWTDGEIVLGRRLAPLLPEDRFDHGPVVSDDGRRALIADLRLDNREELIAALGVDATAARSWPDARILMSALERWDEAALDRIVGDFAFAYWDAAKQRLLLARDFLGHRPLHFHPGHGFFALASMPKGLHALEAIPLRLNEPMMGRFLALLPETGSDSFFQGVQKVRAGHFCVVTRSGVSEHCYWQPSRKELRLRDSGEYQEAVREKLDRAVAARLRGSDGRVAAHLSGGLDSSTVAATAARLVGPQGHVAAFTSVPREGYAGRAPRGRFIDEGPLAAAVAAMYPQIEHVLVRAGHRSPMTALDRNFFLFERPLLNLCNGTWAEAIADECRRRKLKILLTGESGNMSFSYAGLELLPELLAQGQMLALAKQIAKLPAHGVGWESALANTFGPFLPAWVWRLVNRARGRRFVISDYSAIRGDVATALADEARAAGVDLSYRPRRDPFGTRLWVLRRTDRGNYYKGYLGGWGVDCRDPTSDRRLVELCLSIPASEFLKEGQPRALARRAFADRLPTGVLNEQRKGLQAIDWHEGLVAGWPDAQSEVGRLGGIPGIGQTLDVTMLQQLISGAPSAGWNNDAIMKKYRLALLRGLSAGHFMRKALGSNL